MDSHNRNDYFGQPTKNNEFTSRTAYINHQPYITNNNNAASRNHNNTAIDNGSRLQQQSVPKQVSGCIHNNNNNNNSNMMCSADDCQCSQVRRSASMEFGWCVDSGRRACIGVAVEGTTEIATHSVLALPAAAATTAATTTTIMKPQNASIYNNMPLQQQQPANQRPYWSPGKPAPAPPAPPQPLFPPNSHGDGKIAKFYEHHMVKCKSPAMPPQQKPYYHAAYNYAYTGGMHKDDLTAKGMRPTTATALSHAAGDKRNCGSAGSSSGGSSSGNNNSNNNNTNKGEHIINPINDLATKDQHPSPNYARKCPQIFDMEEQHVATHLQQGQQQYGQQQQQSKQQQTHLSLYVSTPHFSSDKFMTSSGGGGKQRSPPTTARTATGAPAPEMRYNSSISGNLLERPSALMSHTSTTPGAVCQQLPKYEQQLGTDGAPKAPPLNPFYGSCGSAAVLPAPQNMRTSSNKNYYAQLPPSCDYATPPELYQYSKSALLLPSAGSSATSTSAGAAAHYSVAPKAAAPTHADSLLPFAVVKQEAELRYDSPLSAAAKPHNLYVNPYNVTLPEVARIKKETSPYALTPEPMAVQQEYQQQHPLLCSSSGLERAATYEPLKTDVLGKCNASTAQHCVGDAYYPPPPAKYEECTYSSAYAAAPPALKYQHHTTAPTMTTATASALPLPLPSSTSSSSPLNAITVYHQQQQYAVDNRHCTAASPQNAGLACYNNNMPKAAPASGAQPSPGSKKSQAPKPNYRELINQAYARRNATSEQELNMQIIKKALNVDAVAAASLAIRRTPPGMSEAAAPPPVPLLSTAVAYHTDCGGVHMPARRLTPTKANCLQSNSPSSASPGSLELDMKPARIKLELEKTCNSPLDLSMRTVKTKADSTDYKYHKQQQQPHSICSTSSQLLPNGEYKYANALPRVNFTPNFSLHTTARPTDEALPPAAAPKHSGAVRLAERPAGGAYAVSVVTTQPAAPACYEAPHMRNTAAANVEPAAVTYDIQQQRRASVVVQAQPQPPMAVQLAPAATVAALPHNQLAADKPSVPQTAAVADLPALTPNGDGVVQRVPPQSSYVGEFERNPNFLGRKRHLHEYSNALHNEARLLAKQARYHSETPAPLPDGTVPPPSQPPLVDATAAPSVVVLSQAEQLGGAMPQAPTTTIVAMEQAITTTTTFGSLVAPSAVKTETHSLIAARIRTKAELKGFTFNPPPVITAPVTASAVTSTAGPVLLDAPLAKPLQFAIKVEPEPNVESQESIAAGATPDLGAKEFEPNSLIDFSWSKACNNFVEQLSNHRMPAIAQVKRAAVADWRLTEQREAVSSVSETPYSESVIMSSNTPENSQDNREPQQRTATTSEKDVWSGRGSRANHRTTASAMTTTAGYQAAASMTETQALTAAQTVIQKKAQRLDREKMRAQQERRLAARLQLAGGGSTTESDNELDKRQAERLKKPTKKSKTRQQSNAASAAGKKRYSDCGSDTTTEEEDGPTADGVDLAEKQASRRWPAMERSRNHNNNNLAPGKVSGSEKLGVVGVNSRASNSNSSSSSSEEEEGEQRLPNGRRNNNNSSQNDSAKATIGAAALVAKSKGRRAAATTPEKQNKLESGNNSVKKSGHQVQYSKGGAAVSATLDTTTITTTTTMSASGAAATAKKVYLNTMTRSKRKRELELQIANSKVLRNEKIIRNNNYSTTKIKRKYVRKYGNSPHATSSSGGGGGGGGGVTADRANKELNGAAKNKGDSRQIIVTRLRSRNDKQLAALLKKTNSAGVSSGRQQQQQQQQQLSKRSNKKAVSSAPAATGGNASTATTHRKRNERAASNDILMEVYHYKRSLKIPPSLITIKRPLNAAAGRGAGTTASIAGGASSHKTAESLPDLGRRGFAHEAVPNQRGKSLHCLLGNSGGAAAAVGAGAVRLPMTSVQQWQQPQSIIDLLHSRVVHNCPVVMEGQPSSNNVKKSGSATTTKNRLASCSIGDGGGNGGAPCDLPAPLLLMASSAQYCNEKDDGDDDADDDDNEPSAKRKHFSIFETKVLQTKTRTESKLQQRKEIIREIFVGHDRPASAPPEMIQVGDDCNGGAGAYDGCDTMTYEQKYEQFLQQMNGVNIRNFGRPLQLQLNASASGAAFLAAHIKLEEDTESASALDAEDSQLNCLLPSSNTNSSPATFSSKMPMLQQQQRRRRPGKYLRRKGSSGFDYLRKKKRYNATSNCATANAQPSAMRSSNERNADANYRLRTKTESDVCREIQKWVLNKGVGQSSMHKAARLGYIDVIVYCLDRMGLNPDQKDNAGYTALHEACTNGWLDIARLLLQYGANHSEAAHSGIRPLHEACENDHEEIVRLLLSYGADPLLATYADQTPLMLTSSSLMRDLLNNHLSDVDNFVPSRTPWRCNGPWEIIESSECGFDIFAGAPDYICDMSTALRNRTVSSSLLVTRKLQLEQFVEAEHVMEAKVKSNFYKVEKTEMVEHETKFNTKTVLDACGGGGGGGPAVLDNMERQFNNATKKIPTTPGTTVVKIEKNSSEEEQKKPPEFRLDSATDSDGEIFEFEEAEVLLPPLYLLKDEGTTDKWVLLNDLCNLLKVKSKDTLLNKICPPSSMSAAQKSLLRELKMSDFLEKATCLQLLCAGEKLNICASKVVLIKYNESVKNLLGVKTILMKF